MLSQMLSETKEITLIATILAFTTILAFSVNMKVYAQEQITGIVQVDGHSMEPTFNDESLVFTCDAIHCPFEDVKEGDIISFHSEKQEGVDILHRVYEVNHYEDGSMNVETVGDNPERPFYETVNDDMYIGKVVNKEVWAGNGGVSQ